MNKIFLIIAIVFVSSFYSQSQNLLKSTTNEVSFFSKTPLKNIEAKNNEVISIINTENSEIAVKIPIKSFVFPNKLMQEHFNENYLESEKYPFSTYKGKINEAINFKKDGKYNVTSNGKIVLHGVEKQINFKGVVTVLGLLTTLESAFEVQLADYKIDIPKIVFEEIAEKVKVNFKINYAVKK